MAESIVVSSVGWIGSLLIQEANVLLDVKDDVEKLKRKLGYLLGYLRDADAKSHSDEQVQVLTDDARKLAYDAEDLIDTYILRISPNTHFSDRNWLMKSVHFVYKAPCAYKLGKHVRQLQNNVNELTVKLDNQQVRRISLVALDNQQVRRISLVEEATDSRENETRESYPYEEGEYVIGWEKDIPKLVELLMGQGKNQDVRVLWILGMGGCGKTTLARKLYNHQYVKESFNCWAWVFISQKVNPHHLLLEILKQVMSSGCQHEINPRASKRELVNQLLSFLEKKSYLVVLDDVWNEMALKDIFPALPYSKGSKIIITTRHKNIVQFDISQSCNVYEPPPLDEDQGWQLLSKFAFNHSTDSSQLNVSKFEQLGKKMLRQCRGLPLAIVALAGILRDKTTIGEWQQVSDTVLTQVMESKCKGMSDTVEQILSLSYDDLPSNLKSCFLHLAVYPEDCEIPAGMLTRMWIAEGLVTAHKMLSIEEVATKRLVELSHRFMVQVVKTNFKKEIKVVHLHDLLRDLCITKARQQSFLEVYSPNDPATSSVSPVATQPRRVALHSSTSLPTRVSHLRTLMLLTRSSILHLAYISKEMLDLDTIGSKFKLLRVLNLWGIRTSNGTLPKEMGRLVHLRYLGIRATNIVVLPVSIGCLRNLLTLDYRNVESDDRDVPIQIPNVLRKLVLLRHLFLPMDRPWSVAELDLSSMKNLQSLWGLKQDSVTEAGWLSREMQMLSPTLKKLKVIVSTVDDMRAIFSCPSLKSDGRLHTFQCELRNDVALQDVTVNHLADHQRLNKLILIGNICMDLSALLPVNLIKLELRDSKLKHGDPMSALGALGDLKILKLSNFYMGSRFTCKPGSFPKLEELYLENLQNLTTWRIEQGAFPCLKKLEIVACFKLQDFPQGLVYVTTLKQLEFSGVPKEFAQKAREYGWSSKRRRLPDNYEAIIKQCDSPVDTSSISQLYEQLTIGIFLNNKKQKYWIMSQDEHCCNCFMVFASDLWMSCSGKKKEWRTVRDRDGTIMTAIERQPHASCMEASQKFNTANLSLNVKYEIAWVIKIQCASGSLLVDEVDMLEANPEVHTELIFPDGSNRNHSHSYSHSHPEGLIWQKWIQVPVGIFEATSETIGQDIQLSLKLVNIPSVFIKGFLIKPPSSSHRSQLVGPISSILQEAAVICSLC